MTTIPVRVEEYETLLRIRNDAINEQRKESRNVNTATLVADIYAKIEADEKYNLHMANHYAQRGMLDSEKGCLSAAWTLERLRYWMIEHVDATLQADA